MRPILRVLDDNSIERIIDEARHILCTLGVEIHHPEVLSMLSDHGARTDDNTGRLVLTEEVIDQALHTVPGAFKLYDVHGNETHDFSGHHVHFTPGSSALSILDGATNRIRKPVTADYVRYARVVSQLEYIAAQSTAFIPADVDPRISDSYRLFLSLLYCAKPVVTGLFSMDGFTVMRDFQLAVRGTEEALKRKPLTLFSCCPTSPLQWSDVAAGTVVACARHAIPVEIIAMALSGLNAPVTLTGTLVQHTAEILSGIVISQLTAPGAPVLYGTSSTIFDVRHETTPMGAVETGMLACAANEIGKHLGLPTQAYIGLSDAKRLDAQAGLESGMGLMLGALSGVNSISGPGMMDFENCQSIEKLVVDNEICGMAFRFLEGITPKEDFPALPILQELLAERHLLIADHTRKYLGEEHFVPRRIIDRAGAREETGMLEARVRRRVEACLDRYTPSGLSEEVKQSLIRRMEGEARRYGQDALPERA